MVNAVWSGRPFKKSNTRVEIKGKYSLVYLFGNHIATVDRILKVVTIYHCEHKTVTTKSRLNSLSENIRICQSHGEWYVNGHHWCDDCPIRVYPDETWMYSEFPDVRTSEEIREEKIMRMKTCYTAVIKRNNRIIMKTDTRYSSEIFIAV